MRCLYAVVIAVAAHLVSVPQRDHDLVVISGRPHSSLARRVPAVVYHLLPKATPASKSVNGHLRVRHDRIDKTGAVTLRHAGHLHHIGIGRAHAGTPIVLIVNDLDIRVIAATTGELLRQLVLDPTRDYQPHQK